MKTVEQHETSPDSLDGFLIAGAWNSSVPPRPTGLEEFLAPPPVPDEPRPTVDESGEAPFGAAPSIPAIDPTIATDIKARLMVDDGRDGSSAIIAQGPLHGTAINSPAPTPRTIAAVAAALAVVEPRALVAASDALPVEPVNRARETGDHEDERSGGFLGALLEEGGLADPSDWFSVGPEANPARQSADSTSGFGFRPSESAARSSSSGFSRWNPTRELELGSASNSWGDRVDESPTASFEEIEARLSRVAARLEGAIDRIESTASSSLSARAGGFRGRVDD